MRIKLRHKRSHFSVTNQRDLPWILYAWQSQKLSRNWDRCCVCLWGQWIRNEEGLFIITLVAGLGVHAFFFFTSLFFFLEVSPTPVCSVKSSCVWLPDSSFFLLYLLSLHYRATNVQKGKWLKQIDLRWEFLVWKLCGNMSVLFVPF